MKTIGMPDDVARGLYRILGIALDKSLDMDYNLGNLKLHNDLWVRCDICGQKHFPVAGNTIIKNLTLKCRRCGNLFQVNICA